MIKLPTREDFERLVNINTERNEWNHDYYAHLPARQQWKAWQTAIAEVQRLNATAQPVSDGCKVPEGWKLVPIAPTDKMINAALGIGGFTIRSAYTSMISAAPAAPGGQDD